MPMNYSIIVVLVPTEFCGQSAQGVSVSFKSPPEGNQDESLSLDLPFNRGGAEDADGNVGDRPAEILPSIHPTGLVCPTGQTHSGLSSPTGSPI